MIFSSVALQVPEPHGITLALDSVFSRSAWHIRLWRPTNLISGRTPFSVRIFKRHSFYFFFTFSTVNIKQVQVVCHIVINETHGRLMNYYQTLTENCGIYWSSYVPTYSSVSAFNGPSKTRFHPVYFQPMYQIFIWPLVMYVCMFL